MLKIKVVLLLFITLSPISFAFSQQAELDSLLLAFKNEKNDTTRCKILNELIETEYNDSIWPLYNEELMIFTKSKLQKSSGDLKIFYAEYYALTLNNFGYLYMSKSEMKKAKEYYLKALKIEKEFNNKTGIATVYNNLGFLCRKEGNIKGAVDYYHKALKIHTEVKNKGGMAVAYNNLAFVFDSQNQIDKAVEYYKKSLNLHLEIKDNEGSAIAYGNLAAIYSQFGDPDCKLSKEVCKKEGLLIAINYLNKSIELHKQVGDKALVAGTMNHLGGLYLEKGDPYCTESKEECKIISEQKAIKLFESSLKLRLEIDDQYGLSQSYASLATYHFNKNEIEKAYDYGMKSWESSQLSYSPERIMEAASVLHKIYKTQGKYPEALKMHEQYIFLRDSLNSDENKNSTIKKTFQIDYELQSAKDSLANISKINEERLQNDLKVKQQRYYTYGGLIGFAFMLIIALVSFRAFRNKQKANVLIQQQKLEVENKNSIIEVQKMEVEAKQKEIVESINYAKRIQEAILPPDHFIQKHLSNYFIFYQPKDIVAGDFYWSEVAGDLFFIAAADSTGHGVPGALVSVVCSGALNRSIKEFKLTETGKILDKTKELVVETFEKSSTDVKDGMDISLLCIDKKNRKIYWSGANNPLSYIHPSTGSGTYELKGINSDKQPIGKTDNILPFTTHEIEYVEGTTFYLFTDGYADQFGGPQGKKFRYKNLQKLLIDNFHLELNEQNKILGTVFSEWKGNLEQIDDVCIIGIRL